MRVSYYPGCSLESTARDYDESLRAVFDVLGIELRELEDWNCCGASSAHITDDFLSMALPMRNLEIAEKENNDLLIPCMACFNRLKSAEKAAIGEIKTDVKTSYKGKIKIKHILDFLSEDGNLALIERFVKKPLTGLKIVSYYGCLYARPPEITDVTDYEDPRSMDKLINILGAESRPWSFKTDCCGGNLALTRIDIVKRLGN
ncbi:MAG: disulfide reductase, partial [Deltaproteobacteria bacterium CG_4_8_14_3_um_filter_43_13]